MEAKKRVLHINEPFELPFDLDIGGLEVTKKKNVFATHLKFVHTNLITAFK